MMICRTCGMTWMLIGVLALAAMGLAGCNAVNGMGKDLQEWSGTPDSTKQDPNKNPYK